MQRERIAHISAQDNGWYLSRRGLLQRAGWAVAAAGFSRVPALAADSVSPAMARLSSYMSEARNRALPDEVTEKAKHHILDTFAAMVSGSQLLPGQAALKFARSYGGEKIATVICSNVLCGPMEAALVNGVLGHSDETDDAHAPTLAHPGVAVVPAALAAGEQFGIDGAQFLRAVVLGYDVGTRVVLTMGGASVQSEEHRSTHSIMGIFGAAAAAASAANLNPQQMRWVLDYTAQQSSGIAAWQRDTQHIEKGFVYAGMPARGGVTSALLVAIGLDRRRRHFLRSRQFFPGLRAASESGGTGRKTRRTLRNRGDRHQEMDRGSAHPGAARRAGNSAEAAAFHAGRSAAGDRPGGQDAGVRREQSRDAGYLPAAHGRGDADRQNRVVQIGARQGRGCRIRQSCACAQK